LEKLRVEDRLPSVVLVGEPTNPKAHGDEIKPGRRGSLSGELKVHGVQGHVAYPEKADNPLPKLLKLCAALTDHEFDKGNDYFPATNLEITSIDTGNEADNVVPASAKAKFNVRFNDQWGAQTLEEEIRRLLAETKLSEGEDYSLACKSNAESFLTPEGDWTNLVRDAVEAVTGRKPELSTKGGTSDARFITNYCPVVEYGLINTSAHEVDEHMPLHALHDGVKIYHEILRRYFQ
jgi:succinyl-diaminopimelate desuccinylase